MPRGPRLDAPGTLHHVMIRGIEKRTIAQDTADRKELLRRVGYLSSTTETRIFAFALMPNHLHILLMSGPYGLPAFMRRLLSGYAQYFNRRHKRVGHLFQNRYKSIICDEETYFAKLVAYINLNPLRANLVHSLHELSTYPWTSHAVMMQKTGYDWVERRYVLEFFGNSEATALQAYLDFMKEELGIDRTQELSGGGLIRSHGGWSKVQSMRTAGKNPQGDDRILGNEAFVKKILKDAQDRNTCSVTLEERINRFSRDIEQACNQANVSLSLLSSGSKSCALPAIRKQLAMKAVYEYGISKAETARQLGVTTNAVSYMLKGR